MANLNKQPLRIALLGGETMQGRELEEVIQARMPDAIVSSYAASGEGNFAEQDGEAVYREPITPGAVRPGDVIVFAGSEEGAQKVYELAKAQDPPHTVIDATGFLEGQPEARILAPMVAEPDISGHWLWVVAHPMASALAVLLTRLSQYAGITRAVAEIFEPASERGKKGTAELHQQTTSLLSFKTLDKDVFDTQASFNLLPRYGSEARVELGAIEQRIDRQLGTLLGSLLQPNVLPMPSIRLIQAPVFHGYSISIWVEFFSHVTAKEAIEALASAQIEVRGEEEEPPNNVGVAGQSGLIVGDVRKDRNHNKALWLWMVGDNLRLTADDVTDILIGLRNRVQ